jgi:hypothetical protein
MLSTIDNLREIARRCLAGEPLGEDLAEWLGGSLKSYLEQAYRSVDDALGLHFPPGGIPWWREEAIRLRDAALRELAEHFYGEFSPCGRAREISTIANRYAASSWRFDQSREAMPSRYEGSPKEYLWRAFKSGATMPIGERQLRNIIA